MEQTSYLKLMFKTHVIKSKENVRSLVLRQRNCRFNQESDLRFFSSFYTKGLCKLNCKLEIFLNLCDCVPFYSFNVLDDDRRKGENLIFFSKNEVMLVSAGVRNCNREGLRCIERKKGKSSPSLHNLFWFLDDQNDFITAYRGHYFVLLGFNSEIKQF